MNNPSISLSRLVKYTKEKKDKIVVIVGTLMDNIRTYEILHLEFEYIKGEMKAHILTCNINITVANHV